MKFISLKWKVTLLIVSGALAFGFTVMWLIYDKGSDVLEEELINRGRTIAISIAKPASESVLEDDRVTLRNLVTEASSFLSVAYILIEDVDKEIVADTFNGNVPESLIGANSFEQQSVSEVESNEMLINVPSFGDVYDILVPIDEGFVGFVRVGMNKQFVDDVINNTMFYLLLIMILAIIIAIIGSFLLANRITKPIIYLTEAADKISMGDFDTAIEVKSKDEIGELGHSIERMRESLKAAIDRLRKRQNTRI